MSFHVPERFRVVDHPGAAMLRGTRNGHFMLPSNAARKMPFALRCIASCGDDWEEIKEAGIFPADSVPWEHVSVSIPNGIRCPTWEEMCYVKGVFWDPEDVVVQFHPPESEYVNNARFCLHLWRPVGLELPRPPFLTVGMR